MPAPDLPAVARDLSDAEVAELDELLAALPEPLEPMDVGMLDGYLCGVIVQPELITAEQWLAPVFDIEGRAPPADLPGRERIVSLVLRHHAALNRALHEDGWFDPLIADDDEDAEYNEGEEGEEGEADDADEGEAEEADTAVPSAEAAALAALHPVSQALLPWVFGFETACARFPTLLESQDEAVMLALARILRHLPAESDERRAIAATLDLEEPLELLDDAIDELVACVADLADLTRDERYHVETIRRDAPKVGRNDPCPCGSGRKFKHCHGAS